MKAPVSCFLFFLLFLMQACQGDKKASVKTGIYPADSILPSERMISILTDVQVVEGALLLKRNRGQERKTDVNFYYAGIFHKYRISRSCYLFNLKYYQQDPATFVKIYDEVIQRLTIREHNYDRKHGSNLGVSRNRVN